MDFAAIFGFIVKLAPEIILTIQKEVGDAKSGADKKTMAKDALTGATAAATAAFAPGGSNALDSQLASAAIGAAIDAFDPITTAVNAAKANGTYQAATAAAAAAKTTSQTQTAVK